MYPRPWQRWAWAALPAVSLTALTFIPFIVAWRRRVVEWPTVAVYTLISVTLIAAAELDLDIHAWGATWREILRYAMWAYLITGVAHLALLDRPRPKRASLKA
ncbi:hypothetical protein ABZX42_10500 [Streptomyces sp. NPDC004611]